MPQLKNSAARRSLASRCGHAPLTRTGFAEYPSERKRFAPLCNRIPGHGTLWGCLALIVLGWSLTSTISGARAAGPPDENWPQWRGPGRDGISSSTGLRRSWEERSPELVWMVEGTGRGYASVSIVEGTIFTTGDLDDGQAVVALRAEDGETLWTTPLTAEAPDHRYPGSRCTPTYDEGRLYVVASDGQAVCLDAGSGDVLWRRDFAEWGGRMMSAWGFSESPLIDGDLLICTPGGSDAGLVALDKLTGEERWRCAIPALGDGENQVGKPLRSGAAYSSIVVSEAGGVRQYVQILGQGVVGVRADDGRFLWGYEQVANPTANIPTPIVSGDHVFCSTGYGTGAALLRLTAEGDGIRCDEVYFLPARQLENHHGGMILSGEYLYAGHGHGRGFPVCIHLESGETAWGGDFRGPGRGSAAITMADGLLIYRYQNGLVALIEAVPDEFRLLGTFEQAYQEANSWAHPVVCDGHLYLREQNRLMCYDLRR